VFTRPIEASFDGLLGRAMRNVRQMIRELQGVAEARTIRDVELADATETPVNHGLGVVGFVQVSPPRGASSSGRIEEVRSSGFDRKKTVVLEATGYGATVTVDVRVSR